MPINSSSINMTSHLEDQRTQLILAYAWFSCQQVSEGRDGAMQSLSRAITALENAIKCSTHVV